MTKLDFPATIKEDGIQYRFVESYSYLNEDWILAYLKGRYENRNDGNYSKTFRFMRPDGTLGLNGEKRILYNRPDLLNAPMQIPVAICEGEKDCNRLKELGFIAVTAGSSTSWKPEFAEDVRGRIVELFYDSDEAGRKCRDKILNDISGIAAQIKVIDLPDGYRDVSDYLNDNHTKEELLDLIENTKPYQPEQNKIVKNISKFNCTDLGNAERLAARYGDILRYVWGWGKWIFYDGLRWNIETGNEMALRLAAETVRSIITEAQNQPDEIRTTLIKWSLQSESSHRLNAMLNAAKAIEGFSAYPKEFDKDLMAFNCLNGTIDLCTGNLKPHNPDDLITMLSPVKYDPNATLKLWDDVINTATDNNIELQDYIQKAIGYSLTGDVCEEALFFVHGIAATSKSTFLEAIKSTFGDYATTADFESFLKKPPQSGTLRNDIASLAGKRFVASVEIDEGRKLAEGLINMLTGSDGVTARFLYSEKFTFLPQFKLWLAANHEPKVSDKKEDGIWRRIKKIPFIHSIPQEKRDPKVKKILRNPEIAGAAILAWAVKGCLRWQEERLKEPDVIKIATENYRLEQDPLREFYEDCCIFDPTAYVAVSEMRAAYEQYAKENGIHYTLPPKKFNERFESHGCERKPMRIANEFGTEKVVKCWSGITLQENPKVQEPENIEDELPF